MLRSFKFIIRIETPRQKIQTGKLFINRARRPNQTLLKTKPPKTPTLRLVIFREAYKILSRTLEKTQVSKLSTKDLKTRALAVNHEDKRWKRNLKIFTRFFLNSEPQAQNSETRLPEFSRESSMWLLP